MNSMIELQTILFPKTRIKSIKDLYYHVEEGFASIKQQQMYLEADTLLSFNSYFNSFYEAYWRQKTGLSEYILQITLQGIGRVEVYRDSALNGCYLLEKLDFDEKNKATKTIRLNLDDMVTDMGRIFFDIWAESEVIIEEVRILTDEMTEQAMDKTLSIGICTFNREDYLFDNLQKLHELAQHFSPLQKIIVVNQGNAFTNEALTKWLSEHASLITVIQQENLGGTGGFTRTLYEALTLQTDYHLLMDDDVVIDAQVIETAFNFAVMCQKPCAVGGQMLDLLRPNVLHEYGAKLEDTGYLKPLFAGLNVADIYVLSTFNKVSGIDYNAWWFCLLPMSAVKEIGLPAPIFIRGDDQEYGLRLKRQGIETVALPGVGLWHEPFYVKVGGWQAYYDFRNRMILSSSYQGMKPESANRLFLRIYRLLLCHDYQSVALILQAIEDFYRGVSLFNESEADIHQRIVALAKQYAPKSVDIKFSPLSDKKMVAKWQTNQRRLEFAKQTLLLSTKDFSHRPAKHLLDRQVCAENVQCLPYVKSNGIQSYYYLYQPNRQTFRTLLAKMMDCRKLYEAACKQTNWQQIAKYKTFAYWQNRFEDTPLASNSLPSH